RALPYTYRNVAAAEGALLKFKITGEAGGDWFLLRESGKWLLLRTAIGATIAEVSIPQEIAWRVFTKGIDKKDAKSEILIAGDERLASEVINMVAVMA